MRSLKDFRGAVVVDLSFCFAESEAQDTNKKENSNIT
jgi:hypothetical protein